MSRTSPVSETPDILERLQEESMRLCGRSISRGDLDSGLASNLADAAIYEIERLRGLVDQLNFVVSSGHAQCSRESLVHIDNVVYHLDDIEVDTDGKCAWTDVANALTHIKMCIEPTVSDTSTDREGK